MPNFHLEFSFRAFNLIANMQMSELSVASQTSAKIKVFEMQWFRLSIDFCLYFLLIAKAASFRYSVFKRFQNIFGIY